MQVYSSLAVHLKNLLGDLGSYEKVEVMVDGPCGGKVPGSPEGEASPRQSSPRQSSSPMANDKDGVWGSLFNRLVYGPPALDAISGTGVSQHQALDKTPLLLQQHHHSCGQEASKSIAMQCSSSPGRSQVVEMTRVPSPKGRQVVVGVELFAN